MLAIQTKSKRQSSKFEMKRLICNVSCCCKLMIFTFFLLGEYIWLGEDSFELSLSWTNLLRPTYKHHKIQPKNEKKKSDYFTNIQNHINKPTFLMHKDISCCVDSPKPTERHQWSGRWNISRLKSICISRSRTWDLHFSIIHMYDSCVNKLPV